MQDLQQKETSANMGLLQYGQGNGGSPDKQKVYVIDQDVVNEGMFGT